MTAITIEGALTNARRLRAGEPIAPARPGNARRRVAVGDPQAPAERFFGALAAHRLLDGDGWLSADVHLIAMGDYFDYRVAERERARVEGVLILSWLAAHPREQVEILLGNHDAARVMEF